MNFCQSNVTSVPQANATHGLRETTFDARALRIELGVFLSLFTLAGLLQRQKFLFLIDGQNPPLNLRAVTPVATLSAVKDREFDLDLSLAVAISSLLPTATLFPIRTDGLLLFPVKAEVGGGEAFACLRLPGRVGPRRAAQFDAISLLAAHDQIGIDVTRIHQMDRRQQLFGGEFLMDLVNHLVIRHTRFGRLDLCDQAWFIFITSLGQVRLVADPGRAPFVRVARIRIVRRTNPNSGRNQAVLFGCTPARSASDQIILLHPDLPERLHGRNPRQPLRRISRINSLKQFVTIDADALTQSDAFGFAFGQAVLINARAVTLNPFGSGVRLQPFGSRHRQRVQRVAQSRADMLKAIEYMNGSQYMRRVAALFASFLDQIPLATQ